MKITKQIEELQESIERVFTMTNTSMKILYDELQKIKQNLGIEEQKDNVEKAANDTGNETGTED